MASNFTMRFRRGDDDLLITLNGDFDGSSAHVLLAALKRNCKNNLQISVDTNGLKCVHPFGSNVLQSYLSELRKRSTHIIFSGKNKEVLAG
jgi:anti-anti-sigma regulatory factor